MSTTWHPPGIVIQIILISFENNKIFAHLTKSIRIIERKRITLEEQTNGWKGNIEHCRISARERDLYKCVLKTTQRSLKHIPLYHHDCKVQQETTKFSVYFRHGLDTIPVKRGKGNSENSSWTRTSEQLTSLHWKWSLISKTTIMLFTHDAEDG